MELHQRLRDRYAEPRAFVLFDRLLSACSKSSKIAMTFSLVIAIPIPVLVIEISSSSLFRSTVAKYTPPSSVKLLAFSSILSGPHWFGVSPVFSLSPVLSNSG